MRRHICHTPALVLWLCWGRGGGVAGVLSFRAGAPPATKARRRVDPGNARRRPSARWRLGARPVVAALLLLAPQRGSLACASRARQQKAQKPRVLKFNRPIAFGRGFLSRCRRDSKLSARAYKRRCCMLNSHLVSSRLSFVLADLLAFSLLECLRAASNQQSADTRETCTSRHSKPRLGNNPLEAAPAIEPRSAPLGSQQSP